MIINSSSSDRPTYDVAIAMTPARVPNGCSSSQSPPPDRSSTKIGIENETRQRSEEDDEDEEPPPEYESLMVELHKYRG